MIQENNHRPLVIVRSWGDEPVLLSLHRIDNTHTYVASENSTHPIGLPHDQVVSYDVDRFAQLSTAFASGDIVKLGECWAKVNVDDFACNKYQDILELQHDQENIADSESAAGGHSQ